MATERAKTNSQRRRRKQSRERLIKKVRKLERQIHGVEDHDSAISRYNYSYNYKFSDATKPVSMDYWYEVCVNLKPHEIKLILEPYQFHYQNPFNGMQEAATHRLMEITLGLTPETIS